MSLHIFMNAYNYRRIKLKKSLDPQVFNYLEAIDKGKYGKIKELSNKNNNKKDIVLEIYNNNLLTSKRLNFIIDNCSNDLNVSSTLIKKLIKDNNINLLDIIFNRLKFYDSKSILNLLFHYKQKMSISSSDLKEAISKYIISKGCDVTNYSDFGKKICIYLYSACQNRNVFITKYIIKYGVDLNKKDIKKRTILHHACRYGHSNIVKYLIENGANVNIKTDNGETPLLLACIHEYMDIVKYLIEHKASINEKDITEWTALHFACKNGNKNMVKYLIEHGANINEKNNNKWTPLHFACKNGYKNIVEYLIDQGADTIIENIEGYTPLQVAYKNGHEDIKKIFN